MNDADFMLPALIERLTPEPPARARVSHPLYVEFLRRRIARRVTVADNGCWLWRGSLNRKGYGMMGAFRKKGAYAHRISYAVFIDEEPLPRGWTLDHLCRTRSCVNPFHLEAVPHGENVRRGNTGINWASRTHCNHGHPFDAENTGRRSDGTGRLCRTCRRESDRRAKARKRERAA